MDLKPIVTCYGDKSVYTQLNPELERRLPDTATEWRRSFGRPPKTVKLKARFVNLQESMLVGDIEKASSLHRQPFFHIYWTDCQDVDEYRSKVKDSINEWQRKLKDRGIVDNLIVQVIAQDSLKGNKSKIQFRGSVFDKIKSDFGGKTNDRVAQLWEPMKESQFTKSIESWQSLVVKLRQLLLISFNRHLGKFEDRVRALREKRTEPRWSFTTYFLLHEELAFVFEMMGLYEEALIQYDEIDALLTQLIINSKYGESLACIDIFMRECKCCDGAPMSREPQLFLRELIKTQEATFVDLRHYLFARQCKLLLQLRRPWEIAQRTLDFLHNLVHEVEILKVSMPTGSIACCIVLTVLEVMRACFKRYGEEDIIYSLHFAHLYQYAKHKLEEVGRHCALLPHMMPSETELQVVCSLLSGIGKNQEEGELASNSPTKKLHEALSSKHAFQKLYLELTETAIKIFKNIGRTRAAKSLGMELAEFFMCREEYNQAEPLLMSVYQVYRHERWTLLATQVLMKLVVCQKKLKYLDKYAYSCSMLACESTLPPEKKSKYAQELLQLIRDTLDVEQPIIIRAEPLLRVKDVRIKLLKGIGSVGERIKVELDLQSGLHEEVTCRRISFSLHSSDLRRGSSLNSSKRSLRAMSPTVQENVISSAAMSEEDLSDKTSEDASDVGSNDDGLDPPHLTRVDSAQSVRTEDPPMAKDESEATLECCNVPLLFGINHYTLTVQVPEEGQYFLKQLCVEIGQLNFVWPQMNLTREASGFSVVSDPPKITVSSSDLLAGLSQRVRITISVGPGSIEPNSKLEITSKTNLQLHQITSGTAYISSNLETSPKTEHPYKVTFPSFHEGDDVTSAVAIVTLPRCGPYEKMEFDLVVLAPLSKQSEMEEITEHLMMFSCKWLQPCSFSELVCSFRRPFTVRHIVHCSNESRFIQTVIAGRSPIPLHVDAPTLTIADCPAVTTTPVHNEAPFSLTEGQEMSLLWKVENSEASSSPQLLDCQLKLNFRNKVRRGFNKVLESLGVVDYTLPHPHLQTLFTIQSRIEAPGSDNKLHKGTLCRLNITIINTHGADQVSSPPTPTGKQQRELLYEVAVDTNLWIISGKNSGVVAMPMVFMATCDVTLDVIPQTGGYLPFPDVKLKSYEWHNEEKEGEKKSETTDKDSEKELQESGSKNDSEKNPEQTVSAKISPKEPPVVKPFKCGQVYNATQAIQVLVLPSNKECL
ncbi:trafficking protein particle complex subunit 10-like [Actinia tenebrosa]|uniref:Trafficking protein particle complex subunit 10-like n=1 Tax=Actinia tenebrosa TaxID=6105 RepID=A0A6P8IQJ1_ACTTE|nr:trafficking protein particle complex subunit 10-like [Actinia tenebrosa]